MMKFFIKVVIAALLAGILVQGAFAEEPGYVLITTWGSQGDGDGQFMSPPGVAVDSADNVYVTDRGNHRIQKFDSSGMFLTTWGEYGEGDGQFFSSYGVAVDSADNVYVTDLFRIQKFDSDGTFLTTWGSEGYGDGQFKFPFGVAVDSAGNVYVADASNIRIQKFDSDGTFITTWGSRGDGDGQFRYPMGVAVDSADNIYVTDLFRIQKFYSNGTFITTWGSEGSGDGQFEEPWGVAVDSAGNVYVADTQNSRIQKFDSSGTFLTTWGELGWGDGQFEKPGGVAVDSAGNVYVTDTDNHRIQKFANHPPLADAGDDQTVPAGTAVTLDASNSSDPRSDIISYVWSFSDGGSATGQVFIKGFTTEGTYNATLTVTDSVGLSDSDIINITVTPEEPPLETPMEATEHLIEDIEALDLPKGTENKMVTKLVEVQRYLEHANAKLTAVSAELEEQEADDLVEKVQMIIDAITSGDFEGWK